MARDLGQNCQILFLGYHLALEIWDWAQLPHLLPRSFDAFQTLASLEIIASLVLINCRHPLSTVRLIPAQFSISDLSCFVELEKTFIKVIDNKWPWEMRHCIELVKPKFHKPVKLWKLYGPHILCQQRDDLILFILFICHGNYLLTNLKWVAWNG